MNKRILLLLVALLPLLCAAQNNTAERKISDGEMFYYQPGSIFLYQDYKTNDASLRWLYSVMKTNRIAVLSGKAHFEIFGYIKSGDVGNDRAINSASTQASVVRAYLKTQYGIDHRSCTFAIDTTQNLDNVVQLQIVSGPVPEYANTQILYCESRSSSAIKEAMAGYADGVPYMSYLMYMARRNVNFSGGGDFYALRDGSWERENFEDFASKAKLSEIAAVGGVELYIKTKNGGYQPATIEDIDSGINILYTHGADGVYSFASAAAIMEVAKATNSSFPATAYLSSVTEGFVPAGQTKVEERVVYKEIGRDKPIIGFKTNLLQWAAVMPNIGVEFYMGKLVSLELSGSYTWMSDLLGQEKAYYMWGAGGELRFWTKADGKFNGLFLGLYGHAGQYDFKFGAIGNQGDYYTGGLSIGYVLPVGKHFGVEFAIAGGYLQYVNHAYKWDGKKNVPVDPVNPSITTWKIFPTKATIALLWKF